MIAIDETLAAFGNDASPLTPCGPFLLRTLHCSHDERLALMLFDSELLVKTTADIRLMPHGMEVDHAPLLDSTHVDCLICGWEGAVGDLVRVEQEKVSGSEEVDEREITGAADERAGLSTQAKCSFR